MGNVKAAWCRVANAKRGRIEAWVIGRGVLSSLVRGPVNKIFTKRSVGK